MFAAWRGDRLLDMCGAPSQFVRCGARPHSAILAPHRRPGRRPRRSAAWSWNACSLAYGSPVRRLTLSADIAAMTARSRLLTRALERRRFYARISSPSLARASRGPRDKADQAGRAGRRGSIVVTIKGQPVILQCGARLGCVSTRSSAAATSSTSTGTGGACSPSHRAARTHGGMRRPRPASSMRRRCQNTARQRVRRRDRDVHVGGAVEVRERVVVDESDHVHGALEIELGHRVIAAGSAVPGCLSIRCASGTRRRSSENASRSTCGL